eukprot:Lankesteria_metandrocarpae@DN1440_c0_g1_i1.p1
MADFLDSILSRPVPPPQRPKSTTVCTDHSFNKPSTAINNTSHSGAAILHGRPRPVVSNRSTHNTATARGPVGGSNKTFCGPPDTRYNNNHIKGSHDNHFGLKPKATSAAEEAKKAERRHKIALLRAANRAGSTNAVTAVASVVKDVQPVVAPSIDTTQMRTRASLLQPKARGRPREGGGAARSGGAAMKTTKDNNSQVVICGVVQPRKLSTTTPAADGVQQPSANKATKGLTAAVLTGVTDATNDKTASLKPNKPPANMYGDNFDDLDGFIDDAPFDGNDWQSALRSVTGYNPSAYTANTNADDDDDDNMMESSMFEQANEEKKAARIARREDAEQLKLIVAERAADARSAAKKRRKNT